MSPKQIPMSSVDRAWLRMDSPENPMMICGVLALERPVAIARLKRTLEERFLRFQRFRQRVIDHGDRAFWQEDPLFHLDNHLHRVALPGKADKAELQRLVSDLNSTALDFRRPSGRCITSITTKVAPHCWCVFTTASQTAFPW